MQVDLSTALACIDELRDPSRVYAPAENQGVLMFDRLPTEWRGPGKSPLFHIYDLAAYVTVLIGYLLGIVQAHHLTPLNFILFTALNLAWLALYVRLDHLDCSLQ